MTGIRQFRLTSEDIVLPWLKQRIAAKGARIGGNRFRCFPFIPYEEEINMSKRYTIKTACPQCGCSQLTVMTPEEIKAKYGDVPNIDLECGECMLQYSKPMKEACPEWDQECRLKEK